SPFPKPSSLGLFLIKKQTSTSALLPGLTATVKYISSGANSLDKTGKVVHSGGAIKAAFRSSGPVHLPELLPWSCNQGEFHVHSSIAGVLDNGPAILPPGAGPCPSHLFFLCPPQRSQ